MSLSTLSPHTLKRLPKIKKGLLEGTNYETIGKNCGVTERTIDRDVKAWLESGDFEAWIKVQWMELHGKICGENPEEAYKQVSKLMAKMVTQKKELKTEGTLKLDGLDSAVQKIISFSEEPETDEG